MYLRIILLVSTISASLILTCASTSAYGAPRRFSVTVPDFTLKDNESVIAFRCTVRGGSIVGLSAPLDDWMIKIDNENTSILKAHIVDGVAAFGPGETEGNSNYFRDFIVIQKDLPDKYIPPFYIKVEITIATNEDLTTFRHLRFINRELVLKLVDPASI